MGKRRISVNYNRYNRLHNWYVKPLNSPTNQFLFNELGEEGLCKIKDGRNQEHGVYKCELDLIKQLFDDRVANPEFSFNIFKRGKTSKLLESADKEARDLVKFEKTGVVAKIKTPAGKKFKITIKETTHSKKSKARKTLQPAY